MEGLYRTPRTYFDSGCHEYRTYPVEKKLLDIGYATWHGYDIMDDIRHILNEYPHVSESDIQSAIWQLMARANNVNEKLYFQFDRNNLLETDVRILIEDTMRVFRLPDGDRSKAYLAENPRTMYFRELNAMNGWRTALKEEQQAYEMYSFGHWIMFPGDGELVRKFNLDNATQHCGYLSYVYPEPWYGGPTRAKVIVLGNEARYDDFISRIQNLILRDRAGAAEGVQLMVDWWMLFERFDFYLPGSSSYWKHVSQLDLYNSPTYRYWLTEFRHLAAELDIETNHDFYRKIAVINANPYPSKGAGPLAAGMLPSHYFLRQLVRFIFNRNPETQFILPAEALRPVWQTILGDVYSDLITSKRLLVINKDSSMRLTRNLNTNQATRLHRLLAPES